jgi:hypothetical protein
MLGERSMVIPIELTPALETQLRDQAQQLGIAPEMLARLAVEDLLERQLPDFREAAKRVLDKNRELYERLA